MSHPRVLVLSYFNVGNFGDRLGWHLLNHLLPPSAVVTHCTFKDFRPPAGRFDLMALGIGNSMFQPLLTFPPLLPLMDLAQRRIGIFGTQYRKGIDREQFAKVTGRLGKFRAMWLDVIGHEILPEEKWKVERNRVVAYKKFVRERVGRPRADIATLVA